MVSTKSLKVSIIIPFRAMNAYARESIAYCKLLDYDNYEIIALPDDWDDGIYPIDGVTVIPTGPVGPSQKRDLAAEHVDGEILAFLDDDAYPDRNWLKCAVRHFNSDLVGGVGGPAVTPPSDGVWEQASGAVYQSLLGGGPYTYRYIPRPTRLVKDYPTCNLLVRRSTFLDAGGFSTEFWPGEDTKLCLAITMDLGKKIVYDPGVLVYHHRRHVFDGHLRQVASYALHRGYFAKKFPQTSRLPSYFLPSALVISLIGGLPSLFFPVVGDLYIGYVSFYLALVMLSSIHTAFPNLVVVALTFVGIIVTHLVYGVWFLKGLLARKLLI
jgi:GT2 family glycosyltransferase